MCCVHKLITRRFLTVCLADSVLAFHKHGMQGRSFKNSEVTQEICDRSRIFKLLGSDRLLKTFFIILYDK